MDPADAEAFRQVVSRQGDLLTQHDRTLQEIAASLQDLSVAIHSRRPVSPTPPLPAPSSREPFIPAPERYEGDLGTCRSFLLQCSLVFELQPQTYPTDKSRIAYLIGSLRGEALAWAAAVWERGSAASCSYSAFTEEMRRVFDHPVRGREASQRLLRLRQGSRSVASFAVEFRTLAAESGWNEEALQGVFLGALSDEVKDQLTSREEEVGLDQLIALSIRVDNRLRERRRERGSRSVPTPSFESAATPRSSPSFSAPPRRERGFSPEPMQIGSTRLSSEERERRMRSGACLYCGLSGHLRSGCPALSGKDRARQ